MSQAEASAQYARALKAGQKTYKECVLEGRYPYLQILDEILNDSMVAGRVDMGVIDIPADQIVGTKSAGRRLAFAADFMPLLSADSEFGMKWIELCAAHLSDEGIRDAIRCFEYMGRFYVQEGNKRVSVLKSFGAPSVPAYVTRVIPVYSDDEAVQIYYEFMDFYRLSGQYQVYFSHRGGFTKLQAALGYDPGHIWSPDERRRFQSGFHYFKEAFDKLGGGKLGVTTADALLVWLEYYPIGTLKELSIHDIGRSLSSIWDDVKARAQSEPIEVSVDDDAEEKTGAKGILGRIFGSRVLPNHLNVAFVNQYDPLHSTWIAAHDLGRQTLEKAMSREVTVRVDVAEIRYLGKYAGFLYRLVAAKDDYIRGNPQALQLLDRVLGRFALVLAGSLEVRHERHMDEQCALRSGFKSHLAYCLQKRLALYVADGAADFGYYHIGPGLIAQRIYKLLDFIRDVRNYLHRTAQILAAALLVEHIPIHASGGEVGKAVQVLVYKALVVTEVEVSFRAVLCHVHFPVLVRAHGAGVYVYVRVELLRGHLNPARFEQAAERGRGYPFAQAGDDTSGNENKLWHFLYPLFQTPKPSCRVRQSSR